MHACNLSFKKNPLRLFACWLPHSGRNDGGEQHVIWTTPIKPDTLPFVRLAKTTSFDCCCWKCMCLFLLNFSLPPERGGDTFSISLSPPPPLLPPPMCWWQACLNYAKKWVGGFRSWLLLICGLPFKTLTLLPALQSLMHILEWKVDHAAQEMDLIPQWQSNAKCELKQIHYILAHGILNSTVAILAQGTHWAVAHLQAFCCGILFFGPSFWRQKQTFSFLNRRHDLIVGLTFLDSWWGHFSISWITCKPKWQMTWGEASLSQRQCLRLLVFARHVMVSRVDNLTPKQSAFSINEKI